jgi:DNA polymerase (family 10)
LRYGLNWARCGWLEKADVLNIRTFAKLRPHLARTIARTIEVNDVVFPG